MTVTVAPIPVQPRSKNLRACLLCSVVQTPGDFKNNGCPNCESILELRGSSDHISQYTTNQFEGVLGIANEGWVARWQGIDKYVRGIYAISIKGRLPEEFERRLEEQGIKYRPRDQSDMD